MTMNKQETIKYLTDLMGVAQMAHFKGRPLGVEVNEVSSDDPAAIGIDLVDYENGGMGKSVCKSLEFCTITRDDRKMTGRVYCLLYNPEDEGHELTFGFIGRSDDTPDLDLQPDELPERVLKDVVGWLAKAMRPKPVETKDNQVTALMFYMWNTFNEQECSRVWADDFYPHFWNKWCGFCEQYSRFGAVEHFYAELSNNNRNKLVARAIECYEGDCPKPKGSFS